MGCHVSPVSWWSRGVGFRAERDSGNLTPGLMPADSRQARVRLSNMCFVSLWKVRGESREMSCQSQTDPDSGALLPRPPALLAVFHHKWFLIDFFVSDTEGKKCDIALEKGKEASHQIQISAVMTCDHWSDQQHHEITAPLEVSSVGWVRREMSIFLRIQETLPALRRYISQCLNILTGWHYSGEREGGKISENTQCQYRAVLDSSWLVQHISSN